MKKRGARGRGTIEWHRDRWRVRIKLPNGERRSFALEPGESRAAAEQFRDALLLRLAGTTDDPLIGSATLGAWAITWLEEREKTHRDAGGDRQRWNAYVAGTKLAATKLAALKAADLYRFGRELVSRPSRRGGTLDRQTARNVWTTLRGVIRGAQRAERLEVALASELLAVELAPSPVASAVEMDERIAWITAEEIGRVLALDLTDDQRSAFLVGLFTGMRAGELHGLTWDRVRWAEDAIVVSRSRAGSTKTGTSARVPLLLPARYVLAERWELAGKPRTGLVWPAESGSCHQRGYDWGWSDTTSATFVRFGIRQRAGIARGITWQDATRHSCGVHLLRGTAATWAVPRAYRLEEVSRFLRHSSIRVTERHYAALQLDALPVTAAPPQVPSVSPTSPRGSIGLVAAIAQEGVTMPDSGSRLRDLNSGPTVYETVALPLS